MEGTIRNIKESAIPCDGVMSILESLKQEGRYDLAIVSSSALTRVIASIEKTGQAVYFPPEKVFSAASMVPPTSKPDPAVYLWACKELGVRPEECVAIEDSRSGAMAASRAGIRLMGYVGCYFGEEEAEVEVRRMVGVLRDECGAEVIMHHWGDFRDCLGRIER